MAVNTPLTVVEPVLDMEKKVEVAPVFMIWNKSASCPLADLITKGMELTDVPAVEVASTVKTALANGEVVPMVNWSRTLSLVNLVKEEMEEAVL